MLTRIWRGYEGVIFERDGRVVITAIKRRKNGRKDKRFLSRYVISYGYDDRPNRFKTLVRDLRVMRDGALQKEPTK